MSVQIRSVKLATLCFCSNHITSSVNMRRLTNIILMLAHRLRRWANIKITLVKRPMFAGL